MSNEETKMASIGGTQQASDRFGDIAGQFGMHKYRVPDLLLIAWDSLTDAQQHEAHRTLIQSKRREPVSAA